jgi:hypothetical protein
MLRNFAKMTVLGSTRDPFEAFEVVMEGTSWPLAWHRGRYAVSLSLSRFWFCLIPEATEGTSLHRG